MIVTESKNRKIKICDQILEEIYSQIQKNDYDPEKGGIIVGRENLNNENIILEYISKPLKNDICTRTRYTRKDEGHLKYFEKLYNENNGVYAYWGGMAYTSGRYTTLFNYRFKKLETYC